MNICRRAIVKGRVQGVFYRQNTVNQAKNRHLTGWVKNLENGDVELVVCGPEADVESLCEWLWQGPSAAKVTDVKIIEELFQVFEGFKIV
ncbi:MAG: acylphosphatase [Gammaproteobacteria bacterium]